MSKMAAIAGDEETREPVPEIVMEPESEGPPARDTWYREDRESTHRSKIHLPFKPTGVVRDHIMGITGVAGCSVDHDGHSLAFWSAEMFDHGRVLDRVLEYLGGIHTGRETPKSSEGWGEDWFLSTGASLATMIIPCFFLFFMLMEGTGTHIIATFMLSCYFLAVLGHQIYLRRQARELSFHLGRPMTSRDASSR